MPVDLLPDLSGDKDWSPEKWSPRHRIVVALHLGGDKNKEIARKLGLSEGRVSIILNDPRAVFEVQRMSATVADRTLDTNLRLKLYANEALDEIVEELRSSRSEKVRQNAAFGILDRAGFTPVKGSDAATEPPTLPAAVVERMEATTKEIVQYSGNGNGSKYSNVEPKPTDPATREPVEHEAPPHPLDAAPDGEDSS